MLFSFHPTATRSKAEIASLQIDFNLTDDGDHKDYLGNCFKCHPAGSIKLTQCHMLECVLSVSGFDHVATNTKLHNSPDCSNKLLDHGPIGQPHHQKWSYHLAVGCLSYLQAMIF